MKKEHLEFCKRCPHVCAETSENEIHKQVRCGLTRNPDEFETIAEDYLTSIQECEYRFYSRWWRNVPWDDLVMHAAFVPPEKCPFILEMVLTE